MEDGLQNFDFELKDLILAGSFDSSGGFNFRYGPSTAVFADLVSAPSRASQKKIQAACNKTMAIFPALAANNFLVANKVDFLRHFGVVEDSVPALKALADEGRHLGYRWLMTNAFLRYNCGPFVEDAANGHLDDALLHLLAPQYLPTAFARYVCRREEAEYYALVRLANNMWCNTDRDGYNYQSFTHFSDDFDTMVQEYQVFRVNYLDYLRAPPTVAFLGGDNPPHNHLWGAINTRQDAIKLALEYKGDLREHLRHRRFEQMVRISRRAFNTGSRIYND